MRRPPEERFGAVVPSGDRASGLHGDDGVERVSGELAHGGGRRGRYRHGFRAGSRAGSWRTPSVRSHAWSRLCLSSRIESVGARAPDPNDPSVPRLEPKSGGLLPSADGPPRPLGPSLGGPHRRARLRQPGAHRQPARRPPSTAAVCLHPAGLRRRAGAPLPIGLRHPGPDRAARHVAQRARRSRRPRSRRSTPGSRRDASAPAIVVYVDAWTSLGGSQFLDSPATGRYHTYLCDEVVPFVDGRYRTLAGRGHRGVAGKSSGGYGAMITPMLRPTSSAAWSRTPATRCSRPATCPSSARRRGRCATSTTGRSTRSGPTSARGRAARRDRRRAARRLVHGRLLLGRCRRHRTAAVRRRAPAGSSRDVGALAGLGPGPHGRRPRRRAARPAGHLDRRRPRDDFYLDLGAEAFRRSSRGSASPTTGSASSCSTARTAGIDWRYPEAIGWLAERLSE